MSFSHFGARVNPFLDLKQVQKDMTGVQQTFGLAPREPSSPPRMVRVPSRLLKDHPQLHHMSGRASLPVDLPSPSREAMRRATISIPRRLSQSLPPSDARKQSLEPVARRKLSVQQGDPRKISIEAVAATPRRDAKQVAPMPPQPTLDLMAAPRC